MSKYQSRTIRWALEMMHRNNLLLPAFQRNFVWKHEQVELLFDSLMRGYPISGMLFWKLREDSGKKYHFYKFINDFKEKYHTRSDEVKATLSHADFAVLDGQQRLTALNIGLCGTYAYRKKYAWEKYSEANYPPRRLYLDISRRYEDDDDGKEYHFEFLADHSEDLFDDGDKRWLRVGVVMDCNEEQKWDFATGHGLTHSETKMLDRLWDLVWEKDTISYYEEETEDPDVAVDVFSRINSGGTRLPLSDILMAMTVASWQQREARNEIGELVDTVNRMGFYIGSDYVLKAFLYLYGKDVRFKIGNFDNDFIRECEEHWPQIRDAIINLFALVKSFGLDQGRMTSYYTTLPMLHHLYWTGRYKGIIGTVMYEGDRLIMKRWLMKSILLRTFGWRSDTTLRQARRVLAEHEWQAFPAIEIERDLCQTMTDETFFEQVMETQYNSRQAWVVLSLLYSHKTFENVEYDLDHCHPRASWTEAVCPWNEYNSVVNLQLLPANENRNKGDKPLEDWVSERVGRIHIEREAFIHSQLIPDVDLSVQNFREFYEARKKILIDELKKIL